MTKNWFEKKSQDSQPFKAAARQYGGFRLKINKLCHNVKKIIIISCRRFIKDNLTYRASTLAFSSLLTIVPLLLVIFFFITIFPFISTITLLGKTYILQHFIPSSADKIQLYFHGFILQAYKLPLINIFFLFISITMLVYTIEESLNDIWQVPNRKKYHYVFVIYWIVFLLFPFIIGLSFFLGTYFFSLPWVSATTKWLGLTNLFINIIPLIINTFIFSLLYKYIPNTKVKIREAVLGGFLAAILFEIARMIFVYYITQFPTYALVYGAFAIFPIFLIWLYIFWTIILFSALLVHTAITLEKH